MGDDNKDVEATLTPPVAVEDSGEGSSGRRSSFDSDTRSHAGLLSAVNPDFAPDVAGLRRALSARQVQMIAVAGTIGTGLFLGTGKSLAEGTSCHLFILLQWFDKGVIGGPASILICYSLVGFVVYITLLLLGEMATQYPVAGSFNVYANRFVDDAYGFALSWNYCTCPIQYTN